MRVALLSVVVGAAAACGEGRAIFNVDVFSFIAGDIDTIPYAAPPIVGSVDTMVTPVEVSLLSGLGDSQVDTVYINAAADLINVQGNADVAFELYFAEDQASVYTGAPYFTASGSVNGPGTTQIVGQAQLTDALFSQPTLWVGLRVEVTNNAAAIVQGELVVTALDVRIVLDDRVF